MNLEPTVFGAVASDTVALTFDDSGGPFEITQPAHGQETINSGIYDLRWDVAGTDKAPFDVKYVNVSAFERRRLLFQY